MPRIPEHVINDIRERADIVDIVSSYVRLEQRGRDHWCCCPFHEEDTPSFKVSGTHQTFYCFGCKECGNVFTFVMNYENIGFLDAVRKLADQVGIAIPEPEYDSEEEREAARKQRAERDLAYDLLEQITQWYQHKLTSPEGAAAREYLRGRGLDKSAVDTFRIGYAPDGWQHTMDWAAKLGFEVGLMLKVGLITESQKSPGRHYDRFRGRLMFPIQDDRGRVVGFSGRILTADTDTAKYINSPETPFFHKSRILYGYHLARQNFRRHGGALICEGQLDVIACHRAGLDHAVCAQGTAFTEHHARILARTADQVTLAFDADGAGQKAAVKTIELLHQAQVTVKAVTLPEGEDPDSLLTKGGSDLLRETMAQAQEPIPFIYQLAARQHDPESPQGKSDIVKEVMPALVALREDVARDGYVQWLAEQLGVLPDSVRSTVEDAMRQEREAQRQPRRRESQDQTPGQRPPSSKLMPAFEPPSEPRVALRLLLDLACHYESVAMDLCDALKAEFVPDTPLGRAINKVLAEAALGEWDRERVVDLIQQDQGLVSCPDVVGVLQESQCLGLDPQKEPEHKREAAEKQLHCAALHCISTLELKQVENRREEALRKLVETDENDPEGNAVLQELLELNRRRQELLKERQLPR